MSIVVADRIGNRDVRGVRRLEQRDEPGAMLIGYRDWPGASDDQRNPLIDDLLHGLIHAPQIRAAKRRQCGLKHLAQILALRYRLSCNRAAHQSTCGTLAHCNLLLFNFAAGFYLSALSF